MGNAGSQIYCSRKKKDHNFILFFMPEKAHGKTLGHLSLTIIGFIKNKSHGNFRTKVQENILYF